MQQRLSDVSVFPKVVGIVVGNAVRGFDCTSVVGVDSMA